MTPNPSGRAPNATHGLPPNRRRIFPSGASGEAPVYGELAAAAGAAGFPDISPAQVHKWVSAGLLPSTSQQVSLGRYGFASDRRTGIEEQLLALCRLRGMTKSWDRLAILLWVDGWEISTERLKAAVLAQMPAALDGVRLGEKTLDQLDELAHRKGPATFRRIGVGRTPSQIATEAAFIAFLVAVGRSADLDETSLETIRRIARLGPVQNDGIGIVGSEASETAHLPMATFMGLFSVSPLRSRIENATGTALAAARPRTRFLLSELPDLIRVTELWGGRAAVSVLGGFKTLGRLTPRAGWLAVAVPIILAEVGLVERFDEQVASLRGLADSAPEFVRVAEIYRRRHPEQSRLIRRIGLGGLDQRGLLVPLSPDELAGDT